MLRTGVLMRVLMTLRWRMKELGMDRSSDILGNSCVWEDILDGDLLRCGRTEEVLKSSG